MMRNKTVLFLGLLLIFVCCGAVMPASAQKPAPADKLAAETARSREKITKMGIGGDVTVVQREGKTFHGAITQIDPDTFVMSDVDLKANVELRFDQIKSIEKGYSHASPLNGHRQSPKTRKIIGWSLAGLVGVLIVVIVKGLNDPNF